LNKKNVICITQRTFYRGTTLFPDLNLATQLFNAELRIFFNLKISSKARSLSHTSCLPSNASRCL